MFRMQVNRGVTFLFDTPENLEKSLKEQQKLNEDISKYFNDPNINVDSMIMTVELNLTSKETPPEYFVE